ncbi:MAG TPA: amidohydrolase family protein [Burkholderiaceae bacterium]|nr:amidohydrolase family protein [Burkholderiaceae bacterium]
MHALAFTAGTAAPRAEIPAGACDCHVHVYDGSFPAAPGASLLPPDATVAQYRALQARLGLSRAVLVTPSTYGADNRVLLAGLSQMGEQARGVAVIDGSESEADLLALHRIGVRGIRLNLSLGVTGSIAQIEPLACRIAELGWHLQLLMPPEQLVGAGDLLGRLPVPVVFDHMARLAPGSAFAHPAHAVVSSRPAHVSSMCPTEATPRRCRTRWPARCSSCSHRPRPRWRMCRPADCARWP